MKYELSEKFRMEVLRHLGYALITPFATIILKILLLELVLDVKILKVVLIALGLAYLGIVVINQAYICMKELGKGNEDD